MTNTSPSPFCPKDSEPFNLKKLTAEMLVAPDSDALFSLTRCQQLSVFLNLLLKGSNEETVERLNQECLAHWGKVIDEA